MKKVVFSVLVLFLSLLHWTDKVSAEFRCEGQVNYTFESLPVVHLAKELPQVKNPKETPAPPTPVPTAIVSTVSFAQVEAKGEDEVKAKAALHKVSARLIEKAR